MNILEKVIRQDYEPHRFLIATLDGRYIHGEVTFYKAGRHVLPRTEFKVFTEMSELICTTPHLDFAVSRLEQPELVTE